MRTGGGVEEEEEEVEEEEGPVATTWELSQPQSSSPLAISGANASWGVGKVEGNRNCWRNRGGERVRGAYDGAHQQRAAGGQGGYNEFLRVYMRRVESNNG